MGLSVNVCFPKGDSYFRILFVRGYGWAARGIAIFVGFHGNDGRESSGKLAARPKVRSSEGEHICQEKGCDISGRDIGAYWGCRVFGW